MLMHLGLYASAPESGKSTVAEYLHEQYGFTHLSFASSLKRMFAVLLAEYGITEDKICEYLYSAKGKAEVIPELGVTARYALQTLGTEWGRNLINKDLWVNILHHRFEQSSISTVVDDVRFESELRVFERPNRYLIKIVRPSAPVPQNPGHESNKVLPDHMFDFVIINDNTLEDLYKAVNKVIHDIETKGPTQRICKTLIVKPKWTVVL